MIHFSLRCDDGHEFEGWFSSGDAFDRQVKRRQVACSECGSTKVGKAPMAPSIAGRRSLLAEQPAVETRAEAMRKVALGIKAEVEKNCDYVGPAFAEEARKMHYGERDRRGIYGETSDREAAALTEEGITFARIPWPKRPDS